MVPEIVLCFITVCIITMMDTEARGAALADVGQSLRS